jgi:hypothetical protein
VRERDYERICRQLGIRLTPWQRWACAYLEDRGQRFCIDFGTDNCEDKAEALSGVLPYEWIM